MKGIKKRGRGKVRKKEKVIIAAIMLVAFVGSVSAATLTITPDTAVSGAFVTMEGEGFTPEVTVILSQACQQDIPIIDGRYSKALQKVNISTGDISFTFSACPVEDDLTITVKRYKLTPCVTIDHNMLGFVFSYDPCAHTATVTRAPPIPTGVYEFIEISGTVAEVATTARDVTGTAVDDVTTVRIGTIVTQEITTDASGGFKEVIDTHGIPAGTRAVNATDGVVYAEATQTLSLDADVSGDGYVGVYDCVCIARYVLSVPGYDETTLNIDVADINGDGIVDLRDARCLARQLIGLPCS